MRRQAVKQWCRRAAVLAAIALLVGQGSPAQWGAFCNRIALLAVGLQQPEGGVLALSDRIQAAAGEAAPQTTVIQTTTTAITKSTAPGTAPTKAALSTSQTPSRAKDAGTVLEQMVSTGSDFVQGVAVRNRSGKAFDLAKELKVQPRFAIDPDSAQPQVLIVHTHTTEGYLTYNTGFYNPADVERTKNESKNVCAAGEAVARVLRAAGIATVHDTTIHDFPQYTGAYSRSEQTVKAALKKYPSIQVVLDVHRDAILPSDTSRVKPTAVIGGKKAAQMMIIAGVVSTDALPHPHWQENFHFALQLQKALATKYPQLMRPLYLVASRYNEHLAPGYLLVEIGTDVNTVAEAVYSGELLGKTLAEVLKT